MSLRETRAPPWSGSERQTLEVNLVLVRPLMLPPPRQAIGAAVAVSGKTACPTSHRQLAAKGSCPQSHAGPGILAVASESRPWGGWCVGGPCIDLPSQTSGHVPVQGLPSSDLCSCSVVCMSAAASAPAAAARCNDGSHPQGPSPPVTRPGVSAAAGPATHWVVHQSSAPSDIVFPP